MVMRPLEVVDKDSQDDEAHVFETVVANMKYFEMRSSQTVSGGQILNKGSCWDMDNC